MNKKNQENTKILFVDTNFFLIPWQFKVDIFSEFQQLLVSNYEIIILDKVIDELNSIKNSKKTKGKDKTGAKFALQLIDLMNKKNKLQIYKTVKLETQFEKYSTLKPNVDMLIILEVFNKYVKNLNENQKTGIIRHINSVLLEKDSKSIKIGKDLKRKAIANLKNINKIDINRDALFIATQDKDLRDVLRALKINIIELKQKKYLKIKDY